MTVRSRRQKPRKLSVKSHRKKPRKSSVKSRRQKVGKSSGKKIVYLRKSTRPGKKYMITIGNKTTHFGAAGMSDYTKHKDSNRKSRYLARHKGSREKLGRSGIGTAGWAAATFLWNKPSLSASIKDTERRFGVKVIRGKPRK
jgi:hypothetical protein